MSAINHFLKLRQGDQSIPYALISPLITIGTAPEVTITLPPGSSDERHCRIERREDHQYIIRDLRSSTGTLVNGTRVLEAYLKPGDVITLNETTLEFTNDAEPPKTLAALPLQSRNPLWKQKLQSIPSVARSEFPVLILGPSGSGKEIIAKAIHENSPRSYGPFVCVNCSALTETLIESELFGHVKGSYTGAIGDRKGAFETARGGTLFLDEIGDLPYSLQAKLLRALENNEIRPVGSDRTIKTDVRIVAATHQNLHEKIADKDFRADLFYRLNVIGIQTPALKDRMEDFEDIFYRFCRENRVRFSVQAIQRLKSHNWPGNIRELKNTISRAAALYPSQTIDETKVVNLIDELPNEELTPRTVLASTNRRTNLVKDMEKEMIITRLIANRGNQRRTATDLGMPKSTLHDRIKAYRIEIDSYVK